MRQGEVNDKNGSLMFSSQQLTALGSSAKDGNLTADTFRALSSLFPYCPSCQVSVQKLLPLVTGLILTLSKL